MEHSHDHNDHNACCTSDNYSSLRQSFSEMEFERGIWSAARYNEIDRLKMLLKKGVSADATDSAGYTALHYAARNGHYEACKILLENGASINAQTRRGRATALHRAATQGRDDIVGFLLKSGADANLIDADGYTALHRGIRASATSVCKLLIPCTELTLPNDRVESPEQMAKDIYPVVLPFMSTYLEKKEK